ncbi:MAG TPA: T9SS type A sorting domain-containing protein, partial [Saprospiraceae bacterium]
ERWDFQFCTDCADAFVDAWSEIFKFDQEGNLLKHVNLQTVKAVVSTMGFVRMGEDDMTIQINDINASGTKLLSTLYRIDDDLNLQKKIVMDEVYYLVQADDENNLFTARNIFDDQNPEIKGLSDVIVSGFTKDGGHLWDKYYGGTSWDFPHSLSLSDDGSLYFLANTQSNDFDVTESFGDQDIWLVKLSEGGSTGILDQPIAGTLDVYPNPCYDYFQISSTEPLRISMFDAQGVEVLHQEVNPSNQIEVKMLPAGVYTLRSMNDAQQEFVARLVKF